MHNHGRLALIFGIGLVLGSWAGAAEVVLKSGVRYSKVTILRQTPTTLRVYTNFGEITLQRSQVATIDGKPLSHPAAAPTARATPGEEIATSEPTIEENSTSESSQAATVESAPPRAPRVAVPLVAEPLPTYQHDATMDWKLGAVFLAVLLYLAHLIWVQHQMNRRSKSATLWNAIVFLLPGVGFVAFLVYILSTKAKAYGGREDIAEAQKKRGLFPSEKSAVPLKGQGIGLRFVDENSRVIPTIGLGKKESGLDTAREVLEAAVVQRASDIHIEPQEELCRIRFRVDGQLAEHRILTPGEGIRLITSLKSLAEIDVAEKRKAQDGRFRVKTDIREVDFRVATANSIHGEKLVIRILDRKGGLMSLDQVGMSADLEALFDRTIHSRAGMIIVTGPTGSGKTSTLYAALSRLDREKLNIMTIEDPVEYELQGATQIPVAPKAGTTYESGLRSILRQDPDVILVGEMRDAEAATVAIRAALTGHLVFTSLHTRDSIATLIRLEEMGMDRSQMASALIMLVAQRLVRVLCPACRRPVTSTGREMIDIGIEWDPGATIYESVGCEECEGSGFRGRTGIFEVLVLNDAIRQAVQQGTSQEEILTMARGNGFRPYREDGAGKVLLGLTSAAEVRDAT